MVLLPPRLPLVVLALMALVCTIFIDLEHLNSWFFAESASLSGFDEIVDGSLKAFMDASAKLGEEVATQVSISRCVTTMIDTYLAVC